MMSPRPRLWLMATEIVCARSAAEMPVVTPSRASIDTVNAVWWRVWLTGAIRYSPSSCTRCRVMARQIRPRPCLAMKLIVSGLAFSAGMTRSPSFSRDSSSTRMNKRPWRASSITSSIGESRLAVPSGIRRTTFMAIYNFGSRTAAALVWKRSQTDLITSGLDLSTLSPRWQPLFAAPLTARTFRPPWRLASRRAPPGRLRPCAA